MKIAKALQKIGEIEGLIPELWENLPWGDSDFGKFFLAHEELGESITDDEVIFLNNIFFGESILDVGCGGGRSLAALLEQTTSIEESLLSEEYAEYEHDESFHKNSNPSERVHELSITGIDLSRFPLCEASKRIPHGGFVQADMVSLPFANGSFDGLISLFGSWISLTPSDLFKFLGEAFRVLRNESLIVLEAPSCESLEALDQVREWSVTDSSFAGNFPQLLLSENIVSSIVLPTGSQKVYVRKEYVVNLETGALKTYCQFYALHKPHELVKILTRAGFGSVTTYGGFDGSVPDFDSERIVVIGHK
jgi:ubiquinone/menaquinone biosynthesis C-methylase UbiE